MDVNQRIERQVHAYFGVPPDVNVKIGARSPSEFPNYDTLPVTLSRDEKSQTMEFLVSKDGKTLIRMTKIDLTEDPYAATMKKIDLAGRPLRGNPDAKVTIINYDDFECPFCARMHSTLMSEILPLYGDKIKIVYKDYPLSMHPWAKHAANNANCLAKESGQGYWEFADYVHANQRAINGSQKDVQNSFNELDHLTLDIGKKNGADATRLQACIKAQPDSAMKASMAEADSIGVNATPTLFVNGERLEGAVDIQEVKAALNQRLLEAGVQPPAAVAPHQASEFHAVVQSYDPAEKKLVVQYLERAEVQPGMFINPGTIGGLSLGDARFDPKDLRPGATVRVIETQRDGKWTMTIVRAVADKGNASSPAKDAGKPEVSKKAPVVAAGVQPPVADNGNASSPAKDAGRPGVSKKAPIQARILSAEVTKAPQKIEGQVTTEDSRAFGFAFAVGEESLKKAVKSVDSHGRGVLKPGTSFVLTTLSVRAETPAESLEASDVVLVGAKGDRYPGAIWDDSMKAWAASSTGLTADKSSPVRVLFVVRDEPVAGLRLEVNGRTIGRLPAVTQKTGTPAASAAPRPEPTSK